MRRITLSLAVAAVTMTAVACPSYTSHVESDTALGRVVVYRNGIAFYERRAVVTNNSLSLTVPSDKIDDFLKSLTVADAKTGQPLPISYPTRGASHGSDVDMTIHLPAGPSKREVILTYITEAPAWKPSYRLMLTEDGTIKLQGWAIVDNTSGEDWNKVRVGVGSSSALSFKYDLRSVRNVYRETLESKKRFAVAPPRGGATYGDQNTKSTEFELADADIPKPVGHPSYKRPKPVTVASTGARPSADNSPGSRAPVRPAPSPSRAESKADFRTAKRGYRGKKGKRRKSGRWRKGAGRSSGGLGGVGSGGGRAKSVSRKPSRPRAADVARQRRMNAQRKLVQKRQRLARKAERERARRAQRAQGKVRQLAAQLKRQRGTVTIEGFAKPRESGARAKSLSRANNLRNQLIKYGVAPGRLRVSGRGWVRGRSAGVRIVNSPSANNAAAAGKSASARRIDGDAEPVGESHFISEARLTVARGTSALVSILDAKTSGESVYLYQADGSRGNRRYAFKSVRFKNPTDSTLETGPVTVYGKGRFIGEGLADPIPPGATAIVPYALDRQIVVDREGTTQDRIHKLVSIQRGVFTAEIQHSKITKLKITNRLHTNTKVYVRHSLPVGWKLVEAPKVFDKLGRAHLFEVSLKRGETKTVVIRQATPLQKTLSLRSALGIDLIKLYLQAPKDVSEQFAAKMKNILAIHADMADHRLKIESLRQRMGEYRARMNELHTQIVSLKEVKMKAGGSLLRHLQKKMKEISERVQKATIAVVTHQEKEMLARVRFQEAISELTLDNTNKVKDKPKSPPPGSKTSAKATT